MVYPDLQMFHPHRAVFQLCLKFLSSLIYVVVHLGNMAAFDMSLPEAVVSPGKGY